MTEKVSVFEQARAARLQTRAAARSMADLARTLALAGIGAAALAKDETKELASRLVERGALARQEARKMAEDLAERAQQQGAGTQVRVERQMDGILSRLNIPTHDDLAAVNAKIAVLSAKIDAMAAATGNQPETGAEDTGSGIDPSALI